MTRRHEDTLQAPLRADVTAHPVTPEGGGTACHCSVHWMTVEAVVRQENPQSSACLRALHPAALPRTAP
eukprot:7275171-Pyramimonas_sp.AAC.1